EQAHFYRRQPRTDRFALLSTYTATSTTNEISQGAIRGDIAWIGSPKESPTEAGAAYGFFRGADGKWPAPTRFTANTVRSDEIWATTLAAGDDYMAVGVPGYSNLQGCVDVMNPTTGVRIARMTLPGGAQFQRNGSVVAASGEWI